MIEATGNDGIDLDNLLDTTGQRPTNRDLWTSAGGKKFDSGAILVAAAKKDTHVALTIVSTYRISDPA